MKIDVILPCLNEEAALPWVLGRMPEGYRPIVVDNGSTDGSARVAAELGAAVVAEPRRGFGAACHAGLMAATGEVVCFMDADASLDPRQLPLVAEPVMSGAVDLVLSRRVPHADASWPAHARLGNAVLAWRLRRAIGVPLHDLGPMRACRRADLVGLALADRRFGYPLEMVLRAAAAGWRVREADVDYLPRAGRSKVTGTIRGTIRAVADMRRVLAESARPAARGRDGVRTSSPERRAAPDRRKVPVEADGVVAGRDGGRGAAPVGERVRVGERAADVRRSPVEADGVAAADPDGVRGPAGGGDRAETAAVAADAAVREVVAGGGGRGGSARMA